MASHRSLRLISPLLTALMLFSGCGRNDGGPAAEADKQLRVYDVPPGYAEQVKVVLQQAFYPGEKASPIARATVGPDGTVVVLAPAGVHEGVAALVKNLANAPISASPTIEMKYWLVMGQSGSGAIPPELQAIAPALEAVSKAQGGLVFEPLEALSLRSLSDESADISGRSVRIRQEASASGKALIARLDIRPTEGSSLNTRVQLEAGQTLVLGESAFEFPRGGAANAGPRTLYYLVRATVLETPRAP
jgi:hypothetical protein